LTTNNSTSLLKTIEAADFWCGAGGTSTGLVAAVRELGYDLRLTAVNHWQIAVDTHSTNHPTARHFCKAVDSLSPLELFPARRLKILVASPECVHHSRARGGKPRDEQRRADAWDIKRWVEKLFIENLLIENVKEFVEWGPLGADNKPLKSKKGVYFQAFIDFLNITYTLDWKVLNCADYGDATTRERFFLIAKRGKNKKIFFPEPTHAARAKIEKAKLQPNFFGDGAARLKPWRSAREIIDWTIPGKSVFGRKKPLSENTMRRIFAGLFKYSLKPFVMGMGGPTGQQNPRGIDEPVRTILTDGRQSLFIPYLVNLKHTDRRDRSIDEPCFTQTTGNHQMLIEPFLIQFFGEKKEQKPRTAALDKPLWAVTAQGRMGLIEPFLVKFYGGHDAARVDEPLPTVTANYEHYGLAEPFVIPCAYGKKNGNGDGRSHSAGEPLGTITGSNNWAAIEPFIVPCNHGRDDRAHSIDEPMKTITGVDAWGAVEPFLVKFQNNQDAQSVEQPLSTITTKDKFGLVETSLVPAPGEIGLCLPALGVVVFIRFRMLQPKELAAAMSFPPNYHFAGTRDEQVKQIGNAVPVQTARALCKAILEK
jgi:DNA (cytosine-5)-methyltransferase 1